MIYYNKKYKINKKSAIFFKKFFLNLQLVKFLCAKISMYHKKLNEIIVSEKLKKVNIKKRIDRKNDKNFGCR